MKQPRHLVVDGSNIATEGRERPSLAQLDEAVRSFLAERPYETVTVVVDATFGHRIEKKERKAFEAAAASNELVTPPAGAVGRGDAFVLQIANRVDADVLSNDSFQEFHGTYDWLFDGERLFGGKPVPGVGWIFVPRLPVRGTASRKSVRDARDKKKKKHGADRHTDEAAAPAPEPVAVSAPTAPADPPQPAKAADGKKSRGKSGRDGRRDVAGDGPRTALNEPLVYASFVIDHPLGSVVEGTVESFSSHGAYVMVGPVRGYLPLKNLGDPPPRSAREVVKVGETRSFVVERFNPDRRGVDLSLAGTGIMAEGDRPVVEVVASATEEASKRDQPEEAPVSPAASKAPARKTTARKATAKKSPAKKSTATRTSTARKAPAKKAAPARKTTTARKAPAKKAPAAKKTTTARKAPAKKTTAARKAPAKATAKKRTPAKKATTARKSSRS
ncbi:MAG: S1 RNA-binding domain-containing protein [Acidimicrobiales bacterium]